MAPKTILHSLPCQQHVQKITHQPECYMCVHGCCCHCNRRTAARFCNQSMPQRVIVQDISTGTSPKHQVVLSTTEGHSSTQCSTMPPAGRSGNADCMCTVNRTTQKAMLSWVWCNPPSMLPLLMLSSRTQLATAWSCWCA